MKKLLMMLFAAFMMITAVHAQAGRKAKKHKSPEQKAEMKAARMQKDLGLSADQVAQIKEIHVEMAKKTADVKSRRGEDREALKTDLKAIKEVKNERIKGVLTPEQYQKYQELQKERAENRKERHSGKKGREGSSKHPQKKTGK